MKKLFILVPFLLSLFFEAMSQCISADAGPDRITCPSNTVILGTPAQPGYSYSWTPSFRLNNPNIAQPTYTSGPGNIYIYDNITTKYQLVVTPNNASTTNLITNGNFESGNIGFTSDYLYWPNSLFRGGFGSYLIGTNANSMRNYFCGTQRTPGGSKMMVVDGSLDGKIHRFWIQTVNNLTPNTYYKFTFYSSPISGSGSYPRPQLSARINGTVVYTAAPDGLVHCNTWEKNEVVWNSGSNTSADISIVSNSTAATGNDFGIDDIEFIQLCPAGSNNPSDEVLVSVVTGMHTASLGTVFLLEGSAPPKPLNYGSVQAACYGWENAVSLRISASAGDFVWYVDDVLMNGGFAPGIGLATFSNGTQTMTFQPSTYNLRTFKIHAFRIDADCRTPTDVVFVKFIPNFYPGTDPVVLGNNAGYITLRNTPQRVNPTHVAHSPGTSYQWTFPNGVTVSENGQADNIFTPEIDLVVDNTYTPYYHDYTSSYKIPGNLTVYDPEGCSGYYYINVSVPLNFKKSNTGSIMEEGDFKISVSPNPVKDQLRISLGNIPGPISSKIDILNLNGQLVRSISVNSQNVIVNVENLPNGIYMVVFNTGTKIVRQKIIIAK